MMQEGQPPIQSCPLEFSSTFLRLRSDTSVERLAVDDTFWQRLMSGQLGDFHNEFLIAGLSFDTDWSNWEMHPNGDEIVCLLAGCVTFVLEEGQHTHEIELKNSGAYIVVPKGTWHTAKAQSVCRMLFITPGAGTQHRPAVVAVGENR